MTKFGKHFSAAFVLINMKINNFLKVCTEETMKEILKRYLLHNAHASSYTWKYDGNYLFYSYIFFFLST